MIMNNRTVINDDSYFEKIMNSFKHSIFKFMHFMLQNQICTAFLYKVLICIECLQMLYYSLNPHMDYLFKTAFFQYFQVAITYFQLGPVFEIAQGNTTFIIFYIVVGIIFIITALIIASMVMLSRKQIGSMVIYFLKIISFFAVLLVTILVIPFINTFFVILYCQQSSIYNVGMQCYQGIYYVHFAIAFVGLINFLLLVTLFQAFFSELNPHSQLPFACPQNKATIFKLIIKFLLPIYATLDYKANIIKEFVILEFILYIFLITIRYRSLPFFNKQVHFFVCLAELTVFWGTIVSLIHAYLDFGEVDNLGFLYFLIGIPLLCYMMISMLNRKKIEIMNLTMRQIRKEDDFEFYLYTFINLIENREEVDKRIILEGVLNLHIRSCNKSASGCQCRNLIIEGGKEDEVTVRHKKWYLLVKSVLQDGLERYPKCARFHLVAAFILHEKMKNKFKAIYELMITEESKPNTFEEFQMFRFKNIVEIDMIETDLRNTEQKGSYF